MKRKDLWKVLVGAAILLLLAACLPAASGSPATGGSPVELLVEKAADGSSVTLNVDQVLAVKLESNPTTGYGWHIVAVDDTILQSQGDVEYIQQDRQGTPMVGVGGWETLRFKALKSGTTTLTLGYSRSFEPDVPPIEEFTLTVEVK